MRDLIFALSLGFVAVAQAGYDAAGGYVTLTKDEYNAGANFKYSLTTAGNWSDGRAPHSDTNYYAVGIQFYTCAKFEGNSLTATAIRRGGFSNSGWSDMEAKACNIPDLRIVDNGYIAQFGSGVPCMIKGKVTVLGSFKITGGKNCDYDATTGAITKRLASGWYVFDTELVGSETSRIGIYTSDTYKNIVDPKNKAYLPQATEEIGRTGVKFIGDTDGFLGTVTVNDTQTLTLGPSGFANAKELDVASAAAKISAEAPVGATVPVSKIDIQNAGAFVLPSSNVVSVATLLCGNGLVVDCAGLDANAIADGGVFVTTDLTLGGKVTVDVAGLVDLPCASVRLLSVPTSVRELTEEDFELVNAAPKANLKLQVATANGRSEARLVRLFDFPRQPATYDASTGYVTMTNLDVNSGSAVPFYSFNDGGAYPDGDPAGNWSDGFAPHAGTNYYNGVSAFRARKSSEFAGDRLVQLRYFRVAGGQTITIGDWWLLPYGQTIGNFNRITTEGASGGTTTVKGRATFFTSEAAPFCFLGALNNHRWAIRSKLVGLGSAAILVQCTTSRGPGDPAAQNFVDVLGDTTDYWGTFLVSTNFTFSLDANGLPNGTLKVLTKWSKIASYNRNIRIPVGELVAEDDATIDAQDGVVYDFGRLVAKKGIVKTGAGVLAASGVADAADGATVQVEAGAVRSRSEGAFDGFALRFAAGAGLVRSLNDANGVLKTGKAATFEGDTVPLEFVDTESVTDGLALEIAKLKSADAQALYAKLDVGRVRGYKVETTLGDVDADGYRTITSTLTKSGLLLLVR